MPHVTDGLQRALARLRANPHRPPSLALALPDPRAMGRRLRSGTLTRERAVPLTVAGLVLVASLLSVSPASGIKGSGAADAQGAAPRLVAGGGVLGAAPRVQQSTPSVAPAAADMQADLTFEGVGPDGRFLPDGTTLVTVGTDIPDPKGRLVDYYVVSGDSLTGIAHRFGISMMTLWWANHLTSKDELHVGQHLVVPPVDGLVVTVKPGDSLDSISAGAGVDPETVSDYNGLTDGRVLVGMTLILPGALGPGIPAPKATAAPKPAAKPAAKPATKSTASVRSSSTSRYTGGKLSFPLPGHAIAQYFHYGHYGIDIAAHAGDSIHAAAAGTVIYAGWRNNGGGLVVWISHGSGLYTTYNHMSAVSVHTGQRVSRGQIVGRVGMTGWATGPHLHFEVWLNGVPGGVDRRVNPLRYF